MRLCRFFCPELDATTPLVRLDPAESHHCANVLRKQPGQVIELVNGAGILAKAVIESIRSDGVQCRIAERTCQPPPQRRLILLVSIPKGDRMEWLVEKCTELGAYHIAFAHFEFSVKLGSPTLLQKAHKVAVSALKQSGRLYLPHISGIEAVDTTLEELKSRYPAAGLFYGSSQGMPFFSSPLRQVRDKVVIIGPEGGFSDPEYAFFKHWGAQAVCINDAVLRTETAAAAFCALCAAWWDSLTEGS